MYPPPPRPQSRFSARALLVVLVITIVTVISLVIFWAYFVAVIQPGSAVDSRAAFNGLVVGTVATVMALGAAWVFAIMVKPPGLPPPPP